MNNRIPAELFSLTVCGNSPSTASQISPRLVLEPFTSSQLQLEKFIHKHALMALGATFCIGIFLGWVNKRR
jgi:hypothetical protein